MLVPTVVIMPRLRQRLPNAMASLTEPPLESSTTVAPRSWRVRANSSNCFGVSAVTMPTAPTQPRQFGWHATQVNRIGSLRSSRVPPACAEPPETATGPVKAMHSAAAQSSTEPPSFSDSLKLDPSPSRLSEAVAAAPNQHQMILSSKRYEKCNLTSQNRLSDLCTATENRRIFGRCHSIVLFSPVPCIGTGQNRAPPMSRPLMKHSARDSSPCPDCAGVVQRLPRNAGRGL